MNDAYRERAQRPVLWWEVAALRKPAAQVFGRLFSECFGESVVTCRMLSLEIKMHESCEPIEDWQILSVRDVASAERAWGALGCEIEDWFEDGDLLSTVADVRAEMAWRESWAGRLRRIPTAVATYLGLF